MKSLMSAVKTPEPGAMIMQRISRAATLAGLAKHQPTSSRRRANAPLNLFDADVR
jgi:hypothetical protein